MTKTEDRLSAVEEQIQKLIERDEKQQLKLDKITVLTPFEVKSIRWFTKAISGLLALMGLAVLISTLKDVWENFGGGSS